MLNFPLESQEKHRERDVVRGKSKPRAVLQERTTRAESASKADQQVVSPADSTSQWSRSTVSPLCIFNQNNFPLGFFCYE